jgi:hypothetical protein
MNKGFIYIVLLLFVTFAGLWGIPELVKTASYSRNHYPFVYFSSVKKKLMFRESDGRKSLFHDDEGTVYTDEEYDKSLPLLNFRQLTVNGEMPGSIDGVAIDPRELRIKTVNFRYSPVETHTPEIGLYIMYESLPKKAKLESPGDVFRMKDKIEFIDNETNILKQGKSDLFQSALLKAGYTFPAQWTYGNLSIRKAYDEGYFSLDAKGEFYHIKMVNGRPFVRNTQLDPGIKPAYFSMLEVADKRFYGFLFDKKGNVYIIEEAGGKYNPVQLEIDPVNLATDELMILGNLMYWTISVQNQSGKHVYALHAQSLKRVRDTFIAASPNRWNAAAGKIFPFYLTFQKKASDYVVPQIRFTAWTAVICNAVSALLIAFLIPSKSKKQRIFAGIYTLGFGIAGAVALLIIPSFCKK